MRPHSAGGFRWQHTHHSQLLLFLRCYLFILVSWISGHVFNMMRVALAGHSYITRLEKAFDKPAGVLLPSNFPSCILTFFSKSGGHIYDFQKDSVIKLLNSLAISNQISFSCKLAEMMCLSLPRRRQSPWLNLLQIIFCFWVEDSYWRLNAKGYILANYCFEP